MILRWNRGFVQGRGVVLKKMLITFVVFLHYIHNNVVILQSNKETYNLYNCLIISDITLF